MTLFSINTILALKKQYLLADSNLLSFDAQSWEMLKISLQHLSVKLVISGEYDLGGKSHI